MERYINIVDYHQRKNNKHILFNKHVTGCPKCSVPEKYMVINQHGAVYICMSPAWLPKSIGSVLDYNNLLDLLNSHEARAIRSEISRGRYNYCNHNICDYLSILEPGASIVKSPQHPDDFILLDEHEFTEDSYTTKLPAEICFDFDYTCNFRCPSCRNEIINNNHGMIWEENKKIVEKIKHLIIDRYTDSTVTFRWAGGEPFVSDAYLKLWEYIVDTERVGIRNIIQTNGSYLIKRKKLIESFLPYVDMIRISFDAGTKNTYEAIRRNGEWETLLENCRFIKNLIEKSGEKVILLSDFVTQKDNYQELEEYVSVVDNLGFDLISAGKMWNWGTWSDDQFEHLNVSDPTHPEYQKLVSIIKNINNPKFRQTVVA